MSYTYDNAGNVTTITDALAGPQTQEFSYNAAYMVTHASAAGGTYGLYSENYSYSSGNLYNKGGVTNTYGDTAHPHAVTARSNGNTYVYDDNGNQTRSEIGNDVYDLKYDAENRLVEVKKNSTVIATFVYDGDGKQVKGTMNEVTTAPPLPPSNTVGCPQDTPFGLPQDTPCGLASRPLPRNVNIR